MEWIQAFNAASQAILSGGGGGNGNGNGNANAAPATTAAGGGGDGGGNGGNGGNGASPIPTVRPLTVSIFREPFDEIENMLAQNIMASVEETDEYQIALASRFITQNQLV